MANSENFTDEFQTDELVFLNVKVYFGGFILCDIDHSCNKSLDHILSFSLNNSNFFKSSLLSPFSKL